MSEHWPGIQDPVYKNKPVAAPSMRGKYATAWQMGIPDLFNDRKHTTLLAYLVNQPCSHPHWPWYSIGLIHLRDVEGVAPPQRMFEAATHAIVVMALDPLTPLPNLGDCSNIKHLTPIDQAIQFCLKDDPQAIAFTKSLIRMICDGTLICDSDHRTRWQAVAANLSRNFREGHPNG